MDPITLKRRGAPVDRTSDRIIAASSIGLSVAFVGAAGLALLLPEPVRHGLWLSIHLALAGGATTAIAGIMPFFVAAFAAAPPADARLRVAAVAGVSAGALGVTAGVVLGPDWLAVGGGSLYVAGVLLAGSATVRPVRGGLGPARGLVTRSYLVGLAAVGVGASLATLLLAGWSPVASNWYQLKPAHAWLNLFGFVSLVIATTLLHFFPTVVGARIPNHPSGRIMVGALSAGAWLVAVGYAARIDLAVSVGAPLALLGGLALGWYEARVWRTRGRWTTDLSWHAFAMGGLAAATAWFIAGLGIAVIYAHGAAPDGWSVDRLIGPLIGGWVGLALLASATHLVPAVGPGDPPAHARQRRLLGRSAVPRLAAVNLGVALVSVGELIEWPSAAVVGLVVLFAGYLTTAALLAVAAAEGLRWTRTRGSRGPA